MFRFALFRKSTHRLGKESSSHMKIICNNYMSVLLLCRDHSCKFVHLYVCRKEMHFFVYSFEHRMMRWLTWMAKHWLECRLYFNINPAKKSHLGAVWSDTSSIPEGRELAEDVQTEIFVVLSGSFIARMLTWWSQLALDIQFQPCIHSTCRPVRLANQLKMYSCVHCAQVFGWMQVEQFYNMSVFSSTRL